MMNQKQKQTKLLQTIFFYLLFEKVFWCNVKSTSDFEREFCCLLIFLSLKRENKIKKIKSYQTKLIDYSSNMLRQDWLAQHKVVSMESHFDVITFVIIHLLTNKEEWDFSFWRTVKCAKQSHRLLSKIPTITSLNRGECSNTWEIYLTNFWTSYSLKLKKKKEKTLWNA